MKEKDYLKEIVDFGGLTEALIIDWGSRIAYGEPFNENLDEMKYAVETYCICNNYSQNLIKEFINKVIEYSNK